ESLSESLPQIVRVGGDGDGVDYLAIARDLVGGSEAQLFSTEDMQAITSRRDEIADRVASREDRIEGLLKPPEETQVEIVTPHEDESVPGAERVEEIRRSVAMDPTETVETPKEADDV